MVRLRFAPSPTGNLHLGGLRTALFSYLFARQKKGTFIFRLEDTDQRRFVEGAESNLLNMLSWGGLQIDEGGESGGAYGPYRQSERLSLYHRYGQTLLECGHAYYCFCTPETLKAIKDEQSARGLPTRYDGRCRHLSYHVVERRLAEEIPHVLRMKVPQNETIVMPDLVRGTVSIDTSQLDDQVLIKADGFPTYHLAVVVDDHLMRISHVIRGEEWLPSFPKHLLLFRYFNWKPPRFAHLPLILSQDRSKLSKRQGDVAVEDYQKKGYLPEALVNFVALLGWSSGDDQEFFTKEELIEKFNFEAIGKSAAVFDRAKLDWMNQQYIKKLPLHELFVRLIPYIRETPYADLEEGQLKKICAILQPRLVVLADIKKSLPLFFEEKPILTNTHLIEALRRDQSRIVMSAFQKQLEAIDEITEEGFSKMMKIIQKTTGVKGKDLWMPIRYAITLEEQGPELPAVAAIFGKNKCLGMIERALHL